MDRVISRKDAIGQLSQFTGESDDVVQSEFGGLANEGVTEVTLTRETLDMPEHPQADCLCVSYDDNSGEDRNVCVILPDNSYEIV